MGGRHPAHNIRSRFQRNGDGSKPRVITVRIMSRGIRCHRNLWSFKPNLCIHLIGSRARQPYFGPAGFSTRPASTSDWPKGKGPKPVDGTTASFASVAGHEKGEIMGLVAVGLGPADQGALRRLEPEIIRTLRGASLKIGRGGGRTESQRWFGDQSQPWMASLGRDLNKLASILNTKRITAPTGRGEIRELLQRHADLPKAGTSIRG